MHSPAPPSRPWRSRLHPQMTQSFEFDHGQQEGVPVRRPLTGSTRTASEGAASSPLSEHSSAPRCVCARLLNITNPKHRRSAKKQSAFARAQADSRRAFKYYDTPLEEHLLDDVARRRRAMQPRAEEQRSGDESWDGGIPAHYGGQRHPVARRRLASPAKSIGGQSAASSPSQRQWVLKPLESTPVPDAARPTKRWRVVRWLGVAALGAAAVAVGANPGVQAQLCAAAVHVARAVAAAGQRLEGPCSAAAGALAGAARGLLHRGRPKAVADRRVLRDVPPTELRRHLLIEEQRLTLRMLQEKEAAESGPTVGELVSAQLDAVHGAMVAAQAAAEGAATSAARALGDVGKAVDEQRAAVVGGAVAAARAVDVRPALRWAATTASGPLRAARRRREMRRAREAAWAAARRKCMAPTGVDLLHHTARNPDGLLPEQRLRLSQLQRRVL